MIAIFSRLPFATLAGFQAFGFVRKSTRAVLLNTATAWEMYDRTNIF
jgi:hypothetical protein